MGSLLLDSMQTLLSRWRHGFIHTLLVTQLSVQRSVMMRRTLVALGITVMIGVVTTPLGALQPLRHEGGGGLLIVTGILAWLTVPMCLRNGHTYMSSGLRIVGLLSAVAGVALVGSTRYHLPRAAALVTLLISLVAGLVCLFALEEGLVHASGAGRDAPLPSSLRLTEWLFGALILCVFFLPFGAPHLLSDPLAYTILRFIPITVGTVTAWILVEHVGQFAKQYISPAQRIGWIALATQAFFLISPVPFSLGWDAALLLLVVQVTLIHLAQQQLLITAADNARADALAQRRRLHLWKQRHSQAMRDHAAWLALAAHDIKSPLHLMTLLSSQIEHVASTGQPDPLMPEYGRRLYSSCQRFGRFVDLFMDFAGQQVQAPIQLRLARVQPVALVRQVIADEQALIKNSITLTLTPPEDQPGMRLDEEATAHWDKARCEAIVVNLLSNAVKFTERGKILLGCRRRGDKLRIEVWDTGVGISEAQHQTIFEEFRRLGNAAPERDRSFGLGLPMTQRLGKL